MEQYTPEDKEAIINFLHREKLRIEDIIGQNEIECRDTHCAEILLERCKENLNRLLS